MSTLGTVWRNPDNNKRSADYFMRGEKDGRPLMFNLQEVNLGTDVDKLVKDLHALANPEDTTGLYNQDQSISWPQFLDWAINNPNVLPTVFRNEFMEVKGPIYQLFPVKFTAESYFVTNTMYFGRDFADIMTRKTNPRDVAGKVWTVEGHMQFAGLGFVIDKYHMETPDGPKYLSMMTEALFANMWAYMTLTVWHEFWSTPTWYRSVKQLYPFSSIPKTCEEALDMERETFGLVNREPQAMHLILKRANCILEQDGGSVGTVIMTADDAYFINYLDKTNQSFEMSGESALKNRMAGSTLRGLGNGISVMTVPFMTNKLHDEIDQNVMRTTVACGSMARFCANFYSGTGGSCGRVKPEDYREYMSNIEFCSWTTNKWDVYTFSSFLRHCVQFYPMEDDLTYNGSNGRITQEQQKNAGKIDRKWLTNLASIVQRANGIHPRTKTDYKDCAHALDPLLKYNENRLDDSVWWYPMAAVGELSEVRTSTSNLHYIYQCLEARIWAGITDVEKRAYTEGLKLMKDLSYRVTTDSATHHVEENDELLKSIDPDADSGYLGIDEARNVYYFRPNEFGGPLFDKNMMNGKFLGGLGTIPGFLTIRAHMQKVAIAGGAGEIYDMYDVAPDDVSTVIDFLSVFEKLTKRCLDIDAFHDAFSSALLPAYHQHKQMMPLTKAMIVCSYFLIGPYLPPVLLAGTTKKANDLAGGNVASNADIADAIKSIEAHAVLKNAFKTYREFKIFTGMRNELFAIYDYLNKTPEEDWDRKVLPKNLKKAFHGFIILTPGNEFDQGREILKILFDNGEDMANKITKINGFFRSYTSRTFSVIDATTLVQLGIEITTINTKRVDAKLDPERHVCQLHYDYDTLFAVNTALNTGGYIAWALRAGIAASNTKHGFNFIHMIDAERATDTKSVKSLAIFEKEDACFFGGTLISALPFVNLGYYCVPRSGHFVHDIRNHSSAERSAVRYASGYPTTENIDNKRDYEVNVINEYQNTVFRGTAFEQIKQRMTNAQIKMKGIVTKGGFGGECQEAVTSDVITQAIAYPFSGHPKRTGELTDFERRWNDSYGYTDTLGFAARFLLMSSLDLRRQLGLLKQNVPPLFGGSIFRHNEAQWMQSWVFTTKGPIGSMFINENGFDNIVSFDKDRKQYKMETTIAHKPLIEDPRRFYVYPYVRGLDKLGGKGYDYINRGVARHNMGEWKERVLDVIDSGERMGHINTNIACLQSLNSAHEMRPRVHVDLRGSYKRGEWGMRMDNPDGFVGKSGANGPMYEGQAALNEAYQLPAAHDTIPLRPMDYTFKNISAYRGHNYVCSQTNVKVYDPCEVDKYRIIPSHHLWGNQLPGMNEIEQSMASININDHFKGDRLSLFSH